MNWLKTSKFPAYFLFSVSLILFSLSIVFYFTEEKIKSLENQACLIKHLQDAIDINTSRRSLYGSLTKGKSLVISDELLKWENQLLKVGKNVDLWSSLYQKYEVDILCDGLVDMSKTPHFDLETDTLRKPLLQDFLQIEASEWIYSLRAALNDSYSNLDHEVETRISLLKKEKRMNCLVRHMLESILLFSRNADSQIQDADQKSLVGARLLIYLNIYFQIGELKKANELDVMAKDIQSLGVGILCNDVPPIFQGV